MFPRNSWRACFCVLLEVFMSCCSISSQHIETLFPVLSEFVQPMWHPLWLYTPPLIYALIYLTYLFGYFSLDSLLPNQMVIEKYSSVLHKKLLEQSVCVWEGGSDDGQLGRGWKEGQKEEWNTHAYVCSYAGWVGQ